MLERRPYGERPRRYEYHLTDKGEAFAPGGGCRPSDPPSTRSRAPQQERSRQGGYRGPSRLTPYGCIEATGRSTYAYATATADEIAATFRVRFGGALKWIVRRLMAGGGRLFPAGR